MNTTIDIIVPVYNEEKGIEKFYHRLRSISLKANIVFVDNASIDRTQEILETFKDITIIKHKANEGYGASIRDGINNSKGELIVIIDADCEYPPEAIPGMIDKLKISEVVYGSRFIVHKNIQMSFLRMLGNRIISFLFNLLFKQKVTDLYTGFKGLRRSSLDGISLERNGFEHVLEMSVKLAKKGVAIDELFIDYASRQTGRSKMKHISETIKFLYYVCYYKWFKR